MGAPCSEGTTVTWRASDDTVGDGVFLGPWTWAGEEVWEVRCPGEVTVHLFPADGETMEPAKPQAP